MYLIVIEYAKWLLTTRGFSKSTIETYIRAVNSFDEYLQELTFWARGVEYPHTIELDDIEEFAEREKLRGKKVTTVNNYLAGIKVFLKFCSHKGLQVMDYRRVLFAKEPDYHIEALEEKEMKKLLEFMRTDQSKEEIIRMRDYAMWLVLTYGGLRVGEMTNLKIRDIKENLQIIWKGNNRRLVYLYSDYIKVIELYLFLRRRLKIESEYVFVSHSMNSLGRPLNRCSVEKIIRKAGEKVWVKVRPHKLRHTCATQMLEHGGDIVYIGQILGHKNLRTTQTYLDYSNEKLRKTQFLIPQV